MLKMLEPQPLAAGVTYKKTAPLQLPRKFHTFLQAQTLSEQTG